MGLETVRPGRPRHGHCFLINLSLSLSLSLAGVQGERERGVGGKGIRSEFIDKGGRGNVLPAASRF